MSNKIEKVAVLGAGVMGAQLAGHLANAGIQSLLFDINQELAEKGVEVLGKLKPAPLYKPKNAKLITPCNYDDHLKLLKEADWILEAVAERLDIKEKVFRNITPYLKNSAIISSNTSGIPLADLVDTLPEQFRSRFLITHFFNPPRYMRLLELVKGEKTDQEVYDFFADFGENVLGKGIVHAKDTPNFIGNRIGVYGMMKTIQQAHTMNLTVEEVDKLTGTIVGRAKSATFRTADVVGLDTLSHVAQTSYDKGEGDDERDIFKVPDVLKNLIDAGKLGQKTKAGFYKKIEKGVIHSLDMNSGEYSPQKKVRFDGFRLAKDRQTVGEKIAALTYSDDKAGKFFWEILAATLIYSANRIPEISDDIVNMDNAMKWGYGWELGPFETWDAIGVHRSVERMKAEGKAVPAWVTEMLAGGRTSFYDFEDGARTYYDLPAKKAATVPLSDKAIFLNLEKKKGNLIKRGWSASLIDLGDGVLDVEFHSVLTPGFNPIDGSVLDIVNQGLVLLEAGKYKGMVLGHQNGNFSVGANLALILGYAENGEYDNLDKTSKLFQDIAQRIRFSPAPVVAVPFQFCFGGGFEITAPAVHRVASAETYIGAVEVGVGLIPGAGGNLRLLLNLFANAGKRPMSPFQVAQNAFQTIGFAKVATSGEEAKHVGYFLKTDTIVLNSEHLIKTAKDKVLELAEGYQPPAYRDDIKLPGAGGRTAMNMAIKGFKMQGKLSDHDEKIGQKLAWVLTGGDKAGLTKKVDEQYLLDIEREAFVSLAGEPLSQARMKHMLKTGKPLRN